MELRGSRIASGCRFAVVVAQFNSEVTERLLAGALDVLRSADVRPEDIAVVHVPGAFEIPLTAVRLAESGRYDAIICLGCLIKGETMHFEHIASAASTAIMDASIATSVPFTFGVLTTLTEEQAMARAGEGPDNKGREAALAAIEMATLFQQLDRTFDVETE